MAYARARATRWIKSPNKAPAQAQLAPNKMGTANSGAVRRPLQNNERDQAEDEPLALPCRSTPLEHLKIRVRPKIVSARKFAFRSLFMIDNSYYDLICCTAAQECIGIRGLHNRPQTRWVRKLIAEVRSKRLFGGQSYVQSFSERQDAFYEVFG
jgi:hypothetical protein